MWCTQWRVELMIALNTLRRHGAWPTTLAIALRGHYAALRLLAVANSRTPCGRIESGFGFWILLSISTMQNDQSFFHHAVAERRGRRLSTWQIGQRV